jgi:prevent-host-death family protein
MTNMSRRAARYVNIAEAKTHLSDLADKAANGEEVLIARDHKPVVRLVPLASTSGRRKPGSAKGQVSMAPDFDATPPDFRDHTT